MEILLCIVVFLLALDHSSITKILSRPIVMCSLLGLVSGNLSECVLVGSTLEIYYISCEVTNNYMIRTPGFFFASIVACMSVITLGDDSTTSMQVGYSCLAVGMVIAYGLSIINTLFLPMARKAIEKGNDKSLFVSMLIPYVLNGLVYAVLTYVCCVNLETITSTLTTIQSQYWFISNMISTIALLLPCISFAILLRNIGVKDVQGALAGGIATGLVCAITLMPQISNLVIALAAISVGWLTYYVSNTHDKVETKQEIKEETTEVKNEGGAEKWW